MIKREEGAWVAQPVKGPTSAQVTILWFESSSPALVSVLTAQSLLRSLCLPLSLPLPRSHAVSLSNINIKKLFLKNKKRGVKDDTNNLGLRNEKHGGALCRDGAWSRTVEARGMRV